MLEKLRSKPKVVRERYAVFGAAGITSIIAIIWLVSLPVRLGNPVENISQVAKNPDSSGVISKFFSQTKANFATVVNSVSSGLDGQVESDVVPPTDNETVAPSVSVEKEATSTNPLSPSEVVPPRREVQISTTSSKIPVRDFSDD